MDELLGKSILLVDDQPANLRILSAILKRAGFVPRPTTSGRLALQAARQEPPDLILLDIQMPDLSGHEVCALLKQDETLAAIPVMFISGMPGTEEKVRAFDAGAVDFISKPFQEREVLARIRTHLELRSLQAQLERHNRELEARVASQVREIMASQMATLFALAKLTEARDDQTGHHIERVRLYSKLLAQRLLDDGAYPESLSDEYVETLYQTAALHDIGKVGVPDAVLLKPGKLTPEEFEQIKRHTTLGAQTLADVLRRYPNNQFLRMGVEVAGGHHEQWNGAGYPAGLVGEAIPLSARIVALADFYDALTTTRPYRGPTSHADTCAMILARRGTHFDPGVVAGFAALEASFEEVALGQRDEAA